MTEYISLGSNCSITYQLQKYGLRLQAYPFDWTKINLKQLCDILNNDFNDFCESLEFKKISNTHNLFEINNILENENIESSSIILTNKYKIEFAHELSNKYEIEEFKIILSRRIDRFKNLSMNSNSITFIRIELNKIKLSWINQILELIRMLREKYLKNFKLILIICKESNITYTNIFPEFIKVITFENFSSDWKMDIVNWSNIFI